MRIPLLLSLLLALLSAPLQAAEQEVEVWTYYTSPPFITGEGAGLSHDFIDLLNRHTEGRYRFVLKVLPRTRINRNLETGQPGLVLFVSWIWMGDPQQTKYLWSPAILYDRNEVISRVDGKAPTQILFQGPDSLQGLTFGGELGRRYKGLQDAFASGQISRRDARREEQNLDMLVHGRIDVTSMASTVARYKVRQKGLEGRVYFSPEPLAYYTRHLLIVPSLSELEPVLAEFIEGLEQRPEWQRVKERYAVE